MRVRVLVVAAVFASLFAAGCVHRDPMPPPTGPLPGEAQLLAFALPEYQTGKVHDLAQDRGNVVLLDVWATWCEPCRDALPIYQDLAKQYGAKGFRVYAVNVDEDPRGIAAFVEETKLALPILLDKDAEVSEGRLRVKVMPTSFLVDRRGNVRFVHEGFAGEFLAKYQAEIEQLLAEPAE